MITKFKLFEEKTFNYNFKKFEIVSRTDNPSDFYICIENSKNDLFINVIRLGRKKQKQNKEANIYNDLPTWFWKFLFVFTPKVNKMHQNLLKKVDDVEFNIIKENGFENSHPFDYLVENFDYDISKSERIIKINSQTKKFKI